jgi:hypothetical protein
MKPEKGTRGVISPAIAAAGRPTRTVPCRTSPAIHITEDRFEVYALNRLPESEAAPFEEHLLVCEECRKRLAEWDAFVSGIRAAMGGYGGERPN